MEREHPWCEQLRPQVVLLSVKACDREGRPDLKTLEEVEDYKLLRTVRDDWIELFTDGAQFWAEVEKHR